MLCRFGHHARGAVDAVALVQIEPFCDAAGLRQGAREHRAVLDGHAGALRHEGKGRMGRVAEQRGARRAPRTNRRAVVEGPAVAGVAVGGVEDGLDLRVPADVIGLEFLPGATLDPGLFFPRAALGAADPVEHAAGAQPVDHAMVLRPAPDLADDVHDVRRQALARHREAPGDIAGISGGRLADDLCADRRLDAVRADERIAARCRAVGQL